MPFFPSRKQVKTTPSESNLLNSFVAWIMWRTRVVLLLKSGLATLFFRRSVNFWKGIRDVPRLIEKALVFVLCFRTLVTAGFFIHQIKFAPLATAGWRRADHQTKRERAGASSASWAGGREFPANGEVESAQKR
jgi:hypothetical protein